MAKSPSPKTPADPEGDECADAIARAMVAAYHAAERVRGMPQADRLMLTRDLLFHVHATADREDLRMHANILLSLLHLNEPDTEPKRNIGAEFLKAAGVADKAFGSPASMIGRLWRDQQIANILNHVQPYCGLPRSQGAQRLVADFKRYESAVWPRARNRIGPRPQDLPERFFFECLRSGTRMHRNHKTILKVVASDPPFAGDNGDGT